MIKKCLSVALSCLLIIAAHSSLIKAQTENSRSSAAKIKANVLKRGTGEKKRIKVNMLDGRKLSGYISQAGDDSFELTNLKTKQTIAVAYRDVARLRSRGLSTPANIGIAVAVGVGVTVAVIFGIFAATGGSDIFSN